MHRCRWIKETMVMSMEGWMNGKKVRPMERYIHKLDKRKAKGEIQ
jgi:hypothetical protein